MLKMISYNVSRENIREGPKCPHLPHLSSNNVSIGLVAINVIIMMIAIPGNLMIIASILKSPRLRENVTFTFVISLNVADFLVAFLVQPLIMVYTLLNQNAGICLGTIFTAIVACGASITGIIGITLERFVFIVYPFIYHRLFTKSKVYCLIVLFWSISVFLGVLYVNGLDPLLIQGAGVGFFLLSLTISVAANSRLLQITMEKMKKDEKRASMPSGVKSMRVRQIQTTLLILKISVAFAICWLPYGILGTVVAANKSKHQSDTFIILYYISFTLILSNSALNVFIYGMGNTVLAEEVKKMLRLNKISTT